MYLQRVDSWEGLTSFMQAGGYRFAVAQRDDVADAFPGLPLFEPWKAPAGLKCVYFSGREPAIVGYERTGP
jgi:hypothetical protein